MLEGRYVKTIVFDKAQAAKARPGPSSAEIPAKIFAQTKMNYRIVPRIYTEPQVEPIPAPANLCTTKPPRQTSPAPKPDSKFQTTRWERPNPERNSDLPANPNLHVGKLTFRRRPKGE